MSFELSDLPPRYQEQIRRKLAGRERAGRADGGKTDLPAKEPPKKKSKHGNVKTQVDGIRFDSKREARRFLELREMERCGEIRGLRLQQNFTLIEGFTLPTGERVKPEVYRADFAYYRKDEAGAFSIYIVEDAKGYRTDKYRIKRKQVLEKYGIEIREV